MPWNGHNHLTPSSSAPLDTSNGYELAHKHVTHLLHATTKVSLYRKSQEETISLTRKV